MRHFIAIPAVAICVLVSACATRPAREKQQDIDSSIRVVCVPTHYLVGWFGDEEQRLIKMADTNLVNEVYGIVLKVVEPLRYSGQVLTMHHDGVLGSGDPFCRWQIGQRYEFEISPRHIGQFDFKTCSAIWPCKILTK